MWQIASLAVLLFITFLICRNIKGGPFDSEKQQPPHIKQLQEQKYGMDRPALTHFAIYFKSVLKGDLGVSIKFVDRPVIEIIAESLPYSFFLGFMALGIAIVIGIPLGIVGAVRPRWSPLVESLTVFSTTLPSFFLAALLVVVFSSYMRLLPPARVEGPEYWIMPILALSLRPLGIIVGLVKTVVREELHKDYVRTARAKGVSEQSLYFRHILKNTAAPLLAVLGPLTANILTGSFVVEHFFAIPGIAKHFINAILNRDIFLIEGVTLVFGAALLLSNLVADTLTTLWDPRVRSE